MNYEDMPEGPVVDLRKPETGQADDDFPDDDNIGWDEIKARRQQVINDQAFRADFAYGKIPTRLIDFIKPIVAGLHGQVQENEPSKLADLLGRPEQNRQLDYQNLQYLLNKLLPPTPQDKIPVGSKVRREYEEGTDQWHQQQEHPYFPDRAERLVNQMIHKK